MGGVYLGRSRGGRVVAVKVVRPELADDPEFRERFRREVAMARSVGGIWTAAVIDADPDAEQPWLATEYVPGPTLHRAVADHGPLPEHTVRGLAAGLAEALAAVHRAGLVHRDLKPANVLLGPDGPRVIDFGISRASHSSTLTATGAFLGTPGYFSPEQTLGHEVGPPSDIFSLGAVLAFAATGQGPFGNDNTAAMLYRAAHAEADLSQVPAGLRPLLARCLAKDPGKRPTTDELLDELGDVHPQGGTLGLPPAINADIAQHTTELQKTAEATTPVPAASRGDTRSYTAARSVPSAAGNAAEPAPSNALPAENGVNGEIKPAVRKGTQRQATTAVATAERGAVFRTGRRLSSLVIAAALAVACSGVSGYTYSGVTAQALFAFLLLAMVLHLLRALCPALRLEVNGSGLRVSRMGLSREIPWRQVRRVGLSGRGAKQALALWCIDDGATPRSTFWHRVPHYHGGVQLFPLGAVGSSGTRRREAERLHTALEEYAGAKYDTGPL